MPENKSSTTRAERLTPERVSKPEFIRLSRRGIRLVKDLTPALMELRLTRLPEEGLLTSSEAAFFLARSRYAVAALIRAGLLHALKAKSDGLFPFLYRIPVEHVRELAEAELDDERVETIRMAEFETRAGEP